MKFIDFFAGIGGVRLGLEQAGHECIGFCEWDKFARKSYKAIHNTEGAWESDDIRTTTATDIPKADLWAFGFPCQDLSIAGKRAGLQDGQRSGLFYEIIRLLGEIPKENKPNWILAENVKGIFSAGRGFDFLRCVVELGQLGYDLEYQLLNSKDFGVPQNRERVYIVGRLGADGRRKVFPIASTDGENFGKLQEITKGVADSYRIYDSDGLARTLKSEGGGLGAKTGLYAIDLTVNNPKTTKVARCLQARYNKGYSTRSAETTGVLIKEATKTGFAKAEIGDSINIGLPNSKTRRGRVGKKIANTLTTPQEQATLDGARIRRLTPLECWRLQGFTDEYFHKAQAAGVSDTQLYKQAGNAVTVNVARAIGLTLKELENENLHL